MEKLYRPVGEDEVEIISIKSSSLEEGIQKLIAFFKEAQRLPEVKKLMEKYGIKIKKMKEGRWF